MVKDCFGGAEFDELAGAHDRDAYAYVGLIFLIFVRLMIVADASVVWASLCLRCLGGNWVLVPSKLRSGVFRANGNGC